MDQTWLISASQGLVVITEGYPEPLALYNSGTVPLLMTQDLNATSQGAPLPPGGSIVWDPGRPLGVFVASGQTTLVVLANSQPILNVAEALIDLLGLPALIAANIKLAGAPPINSFTTLINQTFNAAGGNSAVVDVSGYQSLDVIVLDTSGAVNTAPSPRQITFFWDNSLADVFYSIDAN